MEIFLQYFLGLPQNRPIMKRMLSLGKHGCIQLLLELFQNGHSFVSFVPNQDKITA